MHLILTFLVVTILVAIGKMLGWDKVILIRPETLQSRPVKIIERIGFTLLMIAFLVAVIWAIVYSI